MRKEHVISPRRLWRCTLRLKDFLIGARTLPLLRESMCAAIASSVLCMADSLRAHAQMYESLLQAWSETQFRKSEVAKQRVPSNWSSSNSSRKCSPHCRLYSSTQLRLEVKPREQYCCMFECKCTCM